MLLPKAWPRPLIRGVTLLESTGDMEPLPTFRYHPEPLVTGSIRASRAVCRCCSRARGYIYAGPVYCEDELREALCPWCIASGVAAEQFDAVFSDDHQLLQSALDDEIVREVTRRTPGFNGWQQEVWLSHCNDVCAFYGDAPREALSTRSAQEQLASRSIVPFGQWSTFVERYHPGGNPSIYLFVCLHCSERLLQLDFT